MCICVCCVDQSIWKDTTDEIQKSLCQHFYDLLTHSKLVPCTHNTIFNIDISFGNCSLRAFVLIGNLYCIILQLITYNNTLFQ